MAPGTPTISRRTRQRDAKQAQARRGNVVLGVIAYGLVSVVGIAALIIFRWDWLQFGLGLIIGGSAPLHYAAMTVPEERTRRMRQAVLCGHVLMSIGVVAVLLGMYLEVTGK